MATAVVNFWEVGQDVTELQSLGTLASLNPAKCGFYDQNVKGEKRIIFVVENAEGKRKKVGCSTYLSKVVREGIATHGENSIKKALLNTNFGYDETKQTFWFTTNTLKLTDVADVMSATDITMDELMGELVPQA